LQIDIRARAGLNRHVSIAADQLQRAAALANCSRQCVARRTSADCSANENRDVAADLAERGACRQIVVAAAEIHIDPAKRRREIHLAADTRLG
jgi:hypothetical protein